MEFIKLNARGISYKKPKNKLNDFSRTSRIGRLLSGSIVSENELAKICDYYDKDKDEFYFDRDPTILNSILNYNSKTRLHFNNTECIHHLINELNYWFDGNEYETMFDFCCRLKFQQLVENQEEEAEFKNKTLAKYNENNLDFDYGRILPKLRKKLWILIDKPKSSYLALVRLNII